MEDGVVIQVFLGHHRLDDVLHQVLVNFVVGHICKGKGRNTLKSWLMCGTFHQHHTGRASSVMHL